MAVIELFRQLYDELSKFLTESRRQCLGCNGQVVDDA